MKGKWIPAEEKILLDSFEDEPSLYSPADANYYNKSFKEEAWNRIIDKVQKIKPSVTKSEVKNKIHNMKKKYVKLQQNAFKGYPDNWEWTSRIKNLFHDLDIKSVTLLDQNNASMEEDDDDEIYIQFPPDDDNLSELSEHLLQDESPMGNDTYYIRPKRKRHEQEDFIYQNNDLGSHKTKQKRKKNVINNIQMENTQQQQHHAAAAAPQQQQQIIMEQMTHNFGLFVESQLNLVNDQVKKNEIIFKLTNCLLDETTKFLKGN